MNIIFNYTYLAKILSGTATTIELMTASLLAGFLMALILTLVSQQKSWYTTLPINCFTFIIRGTPMLLQFFIIYYGSAQFDWIKTSFLWFAFKQPFFCAVFALAINTSAYTAVLFKGAINSVPKGEMEACQALGMSKPQTIWHVILPHALRIALPAYSNEVVMILKGTSLASTITVLDLTGACNLIAARTYQFATCFLIAGIIYLIINIVITGAFKQLEKHLAY